MPASPIPSAKERLNESLDDLRERPRADDGRQHAPGRGLAIGGNRIIAIGSEETVLDHAGPETRFIDANGATLMPGFVESHVHLFSGAYGQTLLQLPGVQGFEALKAGFLAFAASNPDEGLLLAQGTDYEILGKGTRLDRHALDRICPDRPIAAMSYDFHTLFANTAALKAAGLLNGRELPVGNEVVMGEDGLATGELREKFAMLPVLDLRTTAGAKCSACPASSRRSPRRRKNGATTWKS